MQRLRTTIYWDIQLQLRNGFYYAAAFVVIFWIVLLNQVPSLNLAALMPAFVLSNLVINTFYFLAGLVLLEKREGTLEMQIVTPLRSWEYLASKLVTLAFLSLLENLILVGFIHGPGFGWIPLATGLVLAAVIYSLVGFIAVARYDSINEYLLPSMLYVIFFSLPLGPYFGLSESWLFYLHPLQSPLVMMQAAFQPLESWQMLYALVYGGLWIWLLYYLCLRTFSHFIISKEGVRSR
jgi:fluoroquinolone transport system permease protein